MLRTRINRLLAVPLGKALEHLPSFEQFVRPE